MTEFRQNEILEIDGFYDGKISAIFHMFCIASRRKRSDLRDLLGFCVCLNPVISVISGLPKVWPGGKFIGVWFNGFSWNRGSVFIRLRRIYGDIVITLKNFYDYRKSGKLLRLRGDDGLVCKLIFGKRVLLFATSNLSFVLF